MTLEEFRIARGLSISDIARGLEITHEGARLICRGRRRAGPALMAKIAALTGGEVGPADFFPEATPEPAR